MKILFFNFALVLVLALSISQAQSNDNKIIEYSLFDINRVEKCKKEQLEDKDQKKNINKGDIENTSIQKERCAHITFYLAGNGRILLESIQKNFKATLANGQEMFSYSVFVDDLSMDRIRLDDTYKGSVCFGISDYPIIKIEYEIN